MTLESESDPAWHRLIVALYEERRRYRLILRTRDQLRRRRLGWR